MKFIVNVVHVRMITVNVLNVIQVGGLNLTLVFATKHKLLVALHVLIHQIVFLAFLATI